MKAKMDVAEAGLAELTAELLTMTEEVQFVKVLPTAASSQIETNRTIHDLCLIDMTLFTCIFLQYRIKQRLPLLRTMHWRQLVKQLKKQSKNPEKSPQWQRFQFFNGNLQSHTNWFVSLIDILCCKVCITWLCELEQSAGVGGTAGEWTAEEQRTHWSDGGTEGTRRTVWVSYEAKPILVLSV